MSNNKTLVIKDLKKRSVLVSREFNAPLADVWRAYTESYLLDQWWAPAPWRAETKTMNFSVGGHWLYCMVGPAGERHWGRMNYLAIDLHKSYDIQDVFCDENGNPIPTMPSSSGKIEFTKTANGTKVEFKMIFPTEEALQQTIEMGFEQGITTCFEQLEGLFATYKI